MFVKFIDDNTVQLPKEEETASERIARLDKDEALAPSISLFTSTRKGGAFSEDQMHTLVTLFEDLITTTTRIERVTVMKRIEKDPVAKEQLEQFTPLQICDKIRTERKRLAARKSKQGKKLS